MKKLARSAFTTLLAFAAGTTGAQAQTYLPFEFADAALGQRGDIKDVVPRLRVDVPPGVAISQVDFGDVRLNFFSEIHQYMEETNAASRAGAAPAELFSQAAAPGCATHESVNPDALRAACPAVSGALKDAFEGNKFQRVCRNARQAERFVEELKDKGTPDPLALTDLVNQIQFAGDALSRVRTLGAILNPASQAQLRTVITKLRAGAILGDIEGRIQRFKRIEKSINGGSCSSPELTNSLRQTLAGILAELRSAREDVNRLDAEGRAQAEADRRAVFAKGRQRDPLPYGNLSDSDRKLVSFVVGAVYWRMRGGGLVEKPEGTQLTRLYYNLYPSSAIGNLNGGAVGQQAGQGIFARLFEGWGRWFDMGRTPNQEDKYHDLVFMTKRGEYQVGAAADTLDAAGYDSRALRIAGLQMGPVYYYSFERLGGVTHGTELTIPYRSFLEGETSWGEWLIGGTISLGMSKSLLEGHR